MDRKAIAQQAEGERRSYHYGKKNVDWRVYCVPAEGTLKDILAGRGVTHE